MPASASSEVSPAAVALAESLAKVSQVLSATIFLASELHLVGGQLLPINQQSSRKSMCHGLRR